MQSAIMDWISGSLPDWDDRASWLLAHSSVVEGRYERACSPRAETRSITAFRGEVAMSSLLPLLLHGLHEYGYAVLWLTVFIAAVGLPLPINLLLLAAGAFAVRGDFNIVLLISVG